MQLLTRLQDYGLMRNVLLALLLVFPALHLRAEDGHDAWLRYAPLTTEQSRIYAGLPTRVVVQGNSPIEQQAGKELTQGLHAMLGQSFEAVTSVDPATTAILIEKNPSLPAESFQLAAMTGGLRITGADPRGELYGAFHLLELIATLKPLPHVPSISKPAASLRWIDEWDNLDGSIERGYAGRSIFFEDGHVRADLSRVSDYGRLLASIGINGININNVNADLSTLTTEHLHEFARIAKQLRPWGVSISLSVDLSSPQVIGKLSTFDPLAPEVAAWWSAKVDEIYSIIPDLAGFTVKADSEGRAGPSQYGRTPADAANVLARPLARHHGVVLYRGFVYNHHLDWNDPKADRARAGYDNFRKLDGQFEPNVIIQIKHGPIDFQVREPVSPLFAAMPHSAQTVELQITQEYTGQQRHMVFLVPMWKWVLDTDLHAENRSTTVKSIVEGHAFRQPAGGFVGVANVGLEINWMHHPLALANLFGFGKLAWNPDESSEDIVDTWTRLTFGNDPSVDHTINALQLESWRDYESYTGPLGIGTLTDIIGVHFGPGVGSAENNGWGQWFRADHNGVGMDRSVATGTGYIGQYPTQLAATYESLATCPDDLLLFMHHVPYTWKLRDGKTVIQEFYDRHYTGAAAAATYAPRWETLRGKIDDQRFTEVLALLTFQAAHAVVWRDAVNGWFFAESGIPDTQGRVGKHPDRIEAEAMRLDGYEIVPVAPIETASGGKAVVCHQQQACSISTPINRAGVFRIAVQYFDLRQGDAHFDLQVNGRSIATWIANDALPPAARDLHLDGHTSTRFTSSSIQLRPGDIITIHGTPDDQDPAAVDYIALEPETPTRP